MKVLYANPGYYQFLPCKVTVLKENSDRHTNTGTSFSLDTGEERELFYTDELHEHEIYFNVDVAFSNPSHSNLKIPFLKFETNHFLNKYLAIYLDADDNTLVVTNIDKNGTYREIGRIPNMRPLLDFFNINVHLFNNYNSAMLKKEKIEVIVNNDETRKLESVSTDYYSSSQIINVYVGGGIGGAREKVFFSSLVVDNTDTIAKRCIVVPIQIDKNQWKIDGGNYTADDKNLELTYKAKPADFLKNTYVLNNSTEVLSLQMGGIPAFCIGASDVECLIDGTSIGTYALPTQKEYGVETEQIEKNPSNNFIWNVNSISQAKFTIKS